MEDKESRDLVCEFCNRIVATISLPIGSDEKKWARALSGYQCSCPESQPVE